MTTASIIVSDNQIKVTKPDGTEEVLDKLHNMTAYQLQPGETLMVEVLAEPSSQFYELETPDHVEDQPNETEGEDR